MRFLQEYAQIRESARIPVDGFSVDIHTYIKYYAAMTTLDFAPRIYDLHNGDELRIERFVLYPGAPLLREPWA